MPSAKNDRGGVHQVLRKNSGGSDFLICNDQPQIEIRSFPKAAVHGCKAETLRKRRERRRMHLGDVVRHSGTSLGRIRLLLKTRAGMGDGFSNPRWSCSSRHVAARQRGLESQYLRQIGLKEGREAFES